MANLKNCPKCGDLFAKDRFEICPKCLEKENQQISLLKRYLNDNPDAPLSELVRVTGIAEAIITEYVRSNRLISVNESPALKIYCEECNTEITTGRFCRPCREKLSARFASAASGLKPPSKK